MQERLHPGLFDRNTNASLGTHHVGLDSKTTLPRISILSSSIPTSSFDFLDAACKVDSSVGSTFPPGRLDHLERRAIERAKKTRLNSLPQLPSHSKQQTRITVEVA